MEQYDIIAHKDAPYGMSYLPVVPDDEFEMYDGISYTREAIVEALCDLEIYGLAHNIERRQSELAQQNMQMSNDDSLESEIHKSSIKLIVSTSYLANSTIFNDILNLLCQTASQDKLHAMNRWCLIYETTLVFATYTFVFLRHHRRLQGMQIIILLYSYLRQYWCLQCLRTNNADTNML